MTDCVLEIRKTRRLLMQSPDPILQVIIDNIMTLEVLFQSEVLTGNRTLTEIAMKHADTTMANHIRPDGQLPRRSSCYKLTVVC